MRGVEGSPFVARRRRRARRAHGRRPRIPLRPTTRPPASSSRGASPSSSGDASAERAASGSSVALELERDGRVIATCGAETSATRVPAALPDEGAVTAVVVHRLLEDHDRARGRRRRRAARSRPRRRGPSLRCGPGGSRPRPRALVPALALAAPTKGAASNERPTARHATAAKASSSKAGAKGGSKRAPKGASASYRNQVGGWHAGPADPSPPVDTRGRPKLVLRALNTGERVELEALGDEGGFHASALDRAARTLRDPRTGAEHPLEPRLLDVVYHLQRHFGAEELRVVRVPHRRRRRGRTTGGDAPSTSSRPARDEDVARFARSLGFCGVGIYPTSGFVHVDVRERSFYWVDASGPGNANACAASSWTWRPARTRARWPVGGSGHGATVRGDGTRCSVPLGLAGTHGRTRRGQPDEHEAEGGEP